VIDLEPLLPTRRYRSLCHDATLIEARSRGHVAVEHAAGVQPSPRGYRAAASRWLCGGCRRADLVGTGLEYGNSLRNSKASKAISDTRV
jgi:hypothetical protein